MKKPLWKDKKARWHKCFFFFAFKGILVISLCFLFFNYLYLFKYQISPQLTW
jgi:hypothetical protein